MKRLIRTEEGIFETEPSPPKNALLEEDSLNEFYFGVENCGKGFIHREDVEQGKYKVSCAEELTEGNGWDPQDYSLRGLIEDLLLLGFNVFKFETYQELFVWLAK